MGEDTMTPRWDGPPLEAWQAWTPEQTAARLAGLAAPWCVVGGWALDVWLGRESRVHEDLEVAVPKPFLPQMRAQLAGLDLYSIGDGEVLSLAPGAEPPEDKYQIWVAEGETWRLDVMAEPGDAATWVFRRDESVTAPRAQMMGLSPTGVPYLKPQGALLYKAAKLRPKDEADFTLFAPLLDEAATVWLRTLISRLYPGHPWLARLAP
ncbi:nucleotidyltransferase domain-containing protein [Phenylobacterium sp.]|uniref:nucleotidyltransferase domain-containing protein n=1 Tax=Phenylobacterium sp. TaxID=1871053 RepID=UPI00286E91FB|nr:hypothetical protein [Phenylobacterium sp.]